MNPQAIGEQWMGQMAEPHKFPPTVRWCELVNTRLDEVEVIEKQGSLVVKWRDVDVTSALTVEELREIARQVREQG